MGLTDMLRGAMEDTTKTTLEEVRRTQREIKASDVYKVSAMLYCSEGSDYATCVKRALALKEEVDVQFCSRSAAEDDEDDTFVYSE